MGQILGVKDGAEAGSGLFFEVLSGHVGLSVLLEMELAAVPRNPGVDPGQGSLEALVGVAGNRGAGDEVSDGWDRAVAPGLKHGVEFGDSAADLGGGDFQTAEPLQDLKHAGGDHLGDTSRRKPE